MTDTPRPTAEELKDCADALLLLGNALTACGVMQDASDHHLNLINTEFEIDIVEQKE